MKGTPYRRTQRERGSGSAENAEAVAERVDGVTQVIDDIEMPGLDRELRR